MSFALSDSIFKDVNQVQPGTYIKIKSGKVEKNQYWDVDLHKEDSLDPEAKTIEMTPKIVRQSVDTAIKVRLRSDVPLGVYLSGGIDSAAIAGTAAKFMKTDLHAFTVSFTDDKQFDELSLAKKMANSIGAKLHVVEATNNTLVENFKDSLWYSETPTGNLHGVGKFLLSRLASKHVKVVLTGEGSDEIFLGYEYFKDPANPITSNMNGKLKKKEKSVRGKHVDEMEEKIGFVPQHEMRKSFSKKMQKFLTGIFHKDHRTDLVNTHPIDSVLKRINVKDINELPEVRKIQYFSIKGILTPYILSTLGDRAEMSHSIEGRTPLLDHKLFEMGRSIPDDHKIRNKREKFVFREAMKDRVIDEIYSARKWPFTAPPFYVKKSSSSSMEIAIETYLSKEAIEKAGLYDYKSIRNISLILKMFPFESQIKRDINTLLTFVMSVQALHFMYEDSFNETIENKYVGSDVPVHEVKLEEVSQH